MRGNNPCCDGNLCGELSHNLYVELGHPLRMGGCCKPGAAKCDVDCLLSEFPLPMLILLLYCRIKMQG